MGKRTVRLVALVIAVLFLIVAVVPMLFSKVYGVPGEDPTLSPWEQMQAYEQELSGLSEEQVLLEEKKAEYEAELIAVEAQLEAAEEIERQQKESFRNRFATLCDRGAASYLEIVFSAESLSDLVEKVIIVREMAEYDRGMLDAIATVKGEIVENKQRLEELLVEIDQAEIDLENTKAEVESKLAEATAYHESLQQDPEAYGQYLADEDQAQQATRAQGGITNGVGSVDAGRISAGSLLWPSESSYITSAFSPNRVNPVTGVLRPHTGTDIGAAQGTAVWAASGGTVVLAEYNGGYGNCVIIDHGNGVKTLYGHMSAILVSSGQSVNQGTQIGRVGSTGNSTGPHLHYEVLVDGVAVDPMQFY